MTSGSSGEAGRPSVARIWMMAIRPPTLTAAVAPVFVGTAVAMRDEVFHPGGATAALIGAIALQIAANLANDVSDFRRGADNPDRIGPPRVTEQGLLTERQVLRGMLVAFAVATVVGVYLAYLGGWPIIAIGLAAMLAAVTYVGGPWPYGYRGLGEIFVFLFFGVVAVAGTYYVQAGEVTASVLAASVPVGLTVTAILVVNNVRDIDTDRAAGKFTLAVYLGRRYARWAYVLFVAGAYVAAAALWMLGDFSFLALLTLLSLPAAAGPITIVLTRVDGPQMNEALRSTARLHLIFALLLGIGVAV
jgi:1,4-dihydroxy-2-naphthoate octaprenyltransferase